MDVSKVARRIYDQDTVKYNLNPFRTWDTEPDLAIKKEYLHEALRLILFCSEVPRLDYLSEH